MSFAEQMKSVAKELIANFGEFATFTRESAGTFDPITGTKTGITSTDWAVQVTPLTYAEEVFDGDNVQTGDIKLMFAADVYNPKSGDRVSYNGENWYVISVPAFTRVQGSAIVYEVQVRK